MKWIGTINAFVALGQASFILLAIWENDPSWLTVVNGIVFGAATIAAASHHLHQQQSRTNFFLVSELATLQARLRERDEHIGP